MQTDVLGIDKSCGDFLRSATLPLCHYQLSSPESHTAVDFHGFVRLFQLYAVKQKEQERETEKEIAHKKLGYNDPQGPSETKKRRKVQHQAASTGKDTTPAPTHRTR